MTNKTIDDKVLVISDLHAGIFDGVRECIDIPQTASEASKLLREHSYKAVLIDQEAVFLAERSDYSVTGSDIFAALKPGVYGPRNRDTPAYLLEVSQEGSGGEENITQWFRDRGYITASQEERRAA
ncbi:hypothetical protein HZB90_03685 [archaeon]|nr:hypothetical protein [archaeon]